MSSRFGRIWMPWTMVSLSVVSSSSGGAPAPAPNDAARSALFGVMRADRTWAKIHAAEVLMLHGETGAVRSYFLDELKENPLPGYRVGIWRVLAAAAKTQDERAIWVGLIAAVYLDTSAPDRGAAIESLAKLEYRMSGEALTLTRRTADTAAPTEQLIPWWALHLAGEPDALPKIVAGLKSPDLVVRRRSGYVLRWLRITDPAVLRSLVTAAESEAPGTDTHAYLVSSVLALRASPMNAKEWERKLANVWSSGSSSARFEASQTLSRIRSDVAVLPLEPLLSDPDADTRVGAADLILSRSDGSRR